MNKHRNNLPITMGLWSTVLLTTLISTSAQAQTPTTAAANDNRIEATRAPALAPRYMVSLIHSGFKLMTATRAARTSIGSRTNATGLMPMAAQNLQVLGGGTLGRLTKWTGFTSSNSFIGDSTIFESKAGLIGIGTDTPTSKLTVAGMIETTLGGFKFPDGTVQTTAAVSGLQSVFHDATLQGSGTAGSPLGVAIPLVLSGAAGEDAIIQATSTSEGGDGVMGVGGFSNSSFGGVGVGAFGGGSNSGVSGEGVFARGGGSTSSVGGNGVNARGGDSTTSFGGNGVVAIGGLSDGAGKSGGIGVEAFAGPGLNGATNGLAGKFIGDVEINGALNVTGTKNFKIDHPLDPENKYLLHAAVESSEVLNVYSGNVTTNEQGEATVTLPDWFEALNKDLRYQLTVVGTFAQAIVAGKVKHNRFTIKTNAPNVEVSWQVTGVRSDAVMRNHPFRAEEVKPERERGTYLNPEAYDQPEERSVEWARNPELMRRMKEARERMKQKVQANNQ